MDIVINYDTSTKEYKLYEPGTDTLIISMNLTEGLVNLNEFLISVGLVNGDILGSPDISYHLDGETFIAMIKSNVELLKKIQSGPSEFKKSAGKFGLSQASSGYVPKAKRYDSGFSSGGNKKSTSEFSRGSKNFSSGSFSGSKSGFGKSGKGKFGR